MSKHVRPAKPPVTLAELAARLYAARKGLTSFTACSTDVSGVFNVVKQLVDMGESVRLPGIGVLFKYQAAARVARNPATGARITVPSVMRYKLKPSSEASKTRNRLYRRRVRAQIAAQPAPVDAIVAAINARSDTV